MDALWAILIEGTIISVAGSLLHFVYHWCHCNKRIGIIAAVNESTWEHLKIAIIPICITMFVDGFWWSSLPNYFLGKFASIITVIAIILILFYGYKIFTHKVFLIVDIMIFYFAIFAGQAVFYFFTMASDLGAFWNFLALDGIFIIFAFTLVSSFLPPKIALFKDPVTKKYGFIDKKHHH